MAVAGDRERLVRHRAFAWLVRPLSYLMELPGRRLNFVLRVWQDGPLHGSKARLEHVHVWRTRLGIPMGREQ